MEPPAPPAPAPAPARARAAATAFEQLPDAVLVTILRHVPQRERLTSCARVSTAWAAASVPASTDVVLHGRGACRKVAALEAWLRQHAQHVVSLAVGAGYGPLTLPATALARLEHLEVERAWLMLSAQGSSSSSSSPPLLRALRSVKLRSCQMAPASFVVLQRPQLTSLELEFVTVSRDDAAGPYDAIMHPQAIQHHQQAVTALLQAQPQLSLLRLERMRLADAALAPLSAMQQLQELSIIDETEDVSACGVMRLCSHLTSLKLALDHGEGGRVEVLPPLPLCLVSVRLTWMQLHPAPLRGLAQLEQLEQLQLSSCSLLAPAARGEDIYDRQNYLPRLAEGTAALMSALSQLKRLRSLELHDTRFATLNKQQVQAFSALTASSQLSRLELFDSSATSATVLKTKPLPRGALQHMLPRGRVQQQLQVLELEWHSDKDEEDDDNDADAWCVEAADVTSICAACPNLERLSLHNVLRATPEVVSSLGELQRLPLLELSVADSTGWLTNDAAAALAGISGLRQLQIVDARLLTDIGVQHLIALRQLRQLQASYRPEEEDVSGHLHLHTASVDAAPDVWQQLEARLQNRAAVQRARASAHV